MWNNHQEREPARVVESFLETVHSGDVEQAMTYLETVPDSRAGYFLTGEALDNGWEIEDVSLRSREDSSILGNRASVEASISGPDDTEASYVFGLQESDDEWLITEGLTTLRANFNQLPLIEINGFRPDIGPGAGNGVEFYMLPGLYTFYTEGVEALEPVFDQQLFLGNNVNSVGEEDEIAQLPDYATRIPLPQHMQLKDDARDTLQAKVEAYLDDCISDIDDSVEEGCPIGVETDHLQHALDSTETEFSDYRWELLEHPQIDVAIGDDPTHDLDISLLTAEPGAVELTVNAGGTDVVVECPLPATFIQPHFDLNGEIFLGPRESRDQLDHEDNWEAAYEDWTDCSEA